MAEGRWLSDAVDRPPRPHAPTPRSDRYAKTVLWWVWLVGLPLPGFYAWLPTIAGISVWLVLMYVETQVLPARRWRRYQQSLNRR